MATIGFGNGYFDPYVVNQSLAGELLGNAGDRTDGTEITGEPEGGPTLPDMPAILDLETLGSDTDTTTKKPSTGDFAGPFNTNTPEGLAAIAQQQSDIINKQTNKGEGAGAFSASGPTFKGDYGTGQMFGTPTLPDMPGTPTAPSTPKAPDFSNFNPRLGTTPDQTYGGGTKGSAGPTDMLPPGFRREGNSRVVFGPDGTMYVSDTPTQANPMGFLNPDVQRARDWQSRPNLDVNATTSFAPDAIEKIRYLDSIGLATPEEKRFLQTIGTTDIFQQTQPYANWVDRHNAQAKALGLPTQVVDAPTRMIPMQQAFPVLEEYGNLLRQLGASDITLRGDNHTLYKVGDKSPIMQWKSANQNNMALSGDTPFANVLDDLAKLRQIAAAQQQAAAGGGAGGGGGSSAYGPRTRSYIDPNTGHTVVIPDPTAPVTPPGTPGAPGGRPNMAGYGPLDYNTITGTTPQQRAMGAAAYGSNFGPGPAGGNIPPGNTPNPQGPVPGQYLDPTGGYTGQSAYRGTAGTTPGTSPGGAGWWDESGVFHPAGEAYAPGGGSTGGFFGNVGNALANVGGAALQTSTAIPAAVGNAVGNVVGQTQGPGFDPNAPSVGSWGPGTYYGGPDWRENPFTQGGQNWFNPPVAQPPDRPIDPRLGYTDADGVFHPAWEPQMPDMPFIPIGA